jgi:hypothetical protein
VRALNASTAEVSEWIVGHSGGIYVALARTLSRLLIEVSNRLL